jgi:hypothetical protein
MKNQIAMIINDNNKEKNLLNNNVHYKEGGDLTFEKFKEDKKNLDVKIKKIKIINLKSLRFFPFINTLLFRK